MTTIRTSFLQIRTFFSNYQKRAGETSRKRSVPEPLFNKVAGLRAATLLKKRLWHWCFPLNFAKFLKTPFVTEHLRWLFLRMEMPLALSMSRSSRCSSKWLVIDSITQNEESKIACDYIMMLRNNKFEHMVYYFKEIDYLKHTMRGKIWKQQQTEKRPWLEITARRYKVNSMALNLNHNIEKIFDGNPYFLCFCTASWFSKILSWFSKIFHSSLLSPANRNILFHVISPLLILGGSFSCVRLMFSSKLQKK